MRTEQRGASIWLPKAARLTALAAAVGTLLYLGVRTFTVDAEAQVKSDATTKSRPTQIALGKQIFRFETYGDERLWTDQLKMHRVVESAVDPLTALAVGLKVDADVLPPGILGQVDLSSPSTTVALLRLNAVVGLRATVDANNHIIKLGVTCALCHSTVDNSLAPGIGHRLDGHQNSELNVGAIIALSPALSDGQKAIYKSWGPGKYDPRFNIDGKSTPLQLPPIYGLAHVKNETYTAEGPISYWNAYVAVTQMGGQGNFSDPRLGINIVNNPDLVTPRLAALLAYQKSLDAPLPRTGSYDPVAAQRGRVQFVRDCQGCHTGAVGLPEEPGHTAGANRKLRPVGGPAWPRPVRAQLPGLPHRRQRD